MTRLLLAAIALNLSVGTACPLYLPTVTKGEELMSYEVAPDCRAEVADTVATQQNCAGGQCVENRPEEPDVSAVALSAPAQSMITPGPVIFDLQPLRVAFIQNNSINRPPDIGLGTVVLRC